LNPIKSDPVASRIAYLMVWRNARKNHHYGPYPNHPSTPDFLTFSKDSWLVFEGQIPDLYRLHR